MIKLVRFSALIFARSLGKSLNIQLAASYSNNFLGTQQMLLHEKTCEPQHDKTNKMSVRPAKTPISLGIRPVWSESSLCAQWVAKDPMFLHADSDDSDQTARMPRLIWVFAGRTLTLLVLSCRGSCMIIFVYCCCLPLLRVGGCFLTKKNEKSVLTETKLGSGISIITQISFGGAVRSGSVLSAIPFATFGHIILS